MPVKTAKKTAAKKPAPKTAKKTTPADAWAAIESLALENKKTEKAIESLALENEKARQETEKGMKKLQRLIGDLGNRFGEFNEHTLVPDLVAKFKKYNFSFGKISERVCIDDDEHDLHAELDAFLENGTEALAVEVKVNLKPSDVDDHIKRMEKMRAYADLHNDNRKFFAAIAATVLPKDVKTYALKQGFFIIEPSGESVKIVPPVSKAKYW
jgi:hypothetical protein